MPDIYSLDKNPHPRCGTYHQSLETAQQCAYHNWEDPQANYGNRNLIAVELEHGSTHPFTGLPINKGARLKPRHHNIGQSNKSTKTVTDITTNPLWNGTVFEHVELAGSSRGVNIDPDKRRKALEEYPPYLSTLHFINCILSFLVIGGESTLSDMPDRKVLGRNKNIERVLFINDVTISLEESRLNSVILAGNTTAKFSSSPCASSIAVVDNASLRTEVNDSLWGRAYFLGMYQYQEYLLSDKATLHLGQRTAGAAVITTGNHAGSFTPTEPIFHKPVPHVRNYQKTWEGKTPLTQRSVPYGRSYFASEFLPEEHRIAPSNNQAWEWYVNNARGINPLLGYSMIKKGYGESEIMIDASVVEEALAFYPNPQPPQLVTLVEANTWTKEQLSAI